MKLPSNYLRSISSRRCSLTIAEAKFCTTEAVSTNPEKCRPTLCSWEIGTILRGVSVVITASKGSLGFSRLLIVYWLVLLSFSFDTMLEFQQEIHQEGYLAYGDFHFDLWAVLGKLLEMTL